MTRENTGSISQKAVEKLPTGDRESIFWDRTLPGFGVRVYPSGAKVYILQSRAGRKSRRITIGRHGLVTAEQARRKAAQIIADNIATREKSSQPDCVHQCVRSPTVAEVAERYMREHASVRCKPNTVKHYRNTLERHLLPVLGDLRLEEIGRERVATLQYSLHETPATANKTIGLLSRLFSMAEVWGITPDGSNPCRFLRKYKERRCDRFLSEEEFRNLGRVLDEVEAEGRINPSAAAALRLLMLTGCRRNEILNLRWENVDLDAGELHLQDTKTGARSVALSPSACRVLADLPQLPDNPWVITGTKPGKRLANLNKTWLSIRARAGLGDVRIHDLRHSFASRALALGESLPMIGKLLGHRKVETTSRYAHLGLESAKASAASISESLRDDLDG